MVDSLKDLTYNKLAHSGRPNMEANYIIAVGNIAAVSTEKAKKLGKIMVGEAGKTWTIYPTEGVGGELTW